MKGCKGLIGRLFGHDFHSRFCENSFKIVCVRCGEVIKDED